MAKRLQDKCALVTGAAAGIGKAIAEAFVADGARVLLVDRRSEALQTTAEALGAQAETAVVDLGDPLSINKGFARLQQSLGGLDILVNNAAVTVPAAPIEETTEGELDLLLAVNIKGIFLAMKHAYPLLKQSRGCVLNISSMAGLTGQSHHAGYAATKGALNALTKSAAVDWGPDGIRVNAICPAGVRTEALEFWCQEQEDPKAMEEILNRMHSLGYCASPAQIGSVAAFLCSEEASFITGALMPVSGGSECGYKL